MPKAGTFSKVLINLHQMRKSTVTDPSARRNFFGSLGRGLASIVAIPHIFAPTQLSAQAKQFDAKWGQADEWFKKLKGSHRIVYDATSIHDGMSIVWSWVFLDSGNQTGSPDQDLTSMVVFRHNGFALALNDQVWSSYKLGKLLKIVDPVTGVPVTKNPFWDPAEGMMPELGMSIKTLTERGAMFCVCERSLSVNSRIVARNKNLIPENVKDDWVDGLLPGVQLVPSGVWALDRAQQNGCSYCFAG